MNAHTKEITEYYAKIIFLNASSIATAAILLNSVSSSFPTGMGNSSGQIGHNLMDHHFRCGAEAEFDGFQDKYFWSKTRRYLRTTIPEYFR